MTLRKRTRELPSEEELRTRILLPYLQALGIGPENVVPEYRFEIRLGRAVHEISSGKSRTRLTGFADVLVIDGERNNLFIVELKAPGETLTEADRDQGISYARLLDQIAPFVLVTNGSDSILYDSITKNPIDLDSFPSGSEFWRSGRDLATVADLNIRYEALRHFIGYSSDNIRIFSSAQVRLGMRALTGTVDSPARYVPDVYISREPMQRIIDQFVESRHIALVLTGDAGVGKTNIMCGAAEALAEKHIILFFNGPEIFGSFSAVLAAEFNWHFSEVLPLPQIVQRLATLTLRNDVRVILIIDGLDEVQVQGFEREISELARRLEPFNGRLKLLVSVRREEWPRFERLSGNLSPLATLLYPAEPTVSVSETLLSATPPGSPLQVEQLNSEELDGAVRRYTALFELPLEPTGRLRSLCRDPLLLRFIATVFRRSPQPLPSDMAEPLLLQRVLQFQLAKVEGVDRIDKAWLELDAVGRALAERARSPRGPYESLADSVSVTEDLVREVARLPATEPLARNLVSQGILERRIDADGRRSLRFYHRRIQDYVIARRVLRLDELNEREFETRIPDLVAARILEDAVLWHVNHGTPSHLSAFKRATRGRAALFAERYQATLDELFPALKPLVNPETSGSIGVAFGLDGKGLYGVGFFPADGPGTRVVEYDPATTPRDFHWRELNTLGGHVTLGSGGDFLRNDPTAIAYEMAWAAVLDAVKSGELVEPAVLNEETTLALIHKLRKELGIPAAPWIDWTGGLLPMELHSVLAHFPRVGTWEWHALARSVQALIRDHAVLSIPLLPPPDQPIQEISSFDDGYSDSQVVSYFQTLFLTALKTYRALVEVNFPRLKQELPLIGISAVRVIVAYERASEPASTFNHWGKVAFGFVASDLGIDCVEVYLQPWFSDV